MHFRDLKIYALCSLLIVVVVCLFTFFYFSINREKIQDTTKESSIVDCKSNLLEMNGDIIELKIEFNSDIDCPVQEVMNLRENYRDLFINEVGTCIATADEIENTTDNAYYLYFLSSDGRVGKTSLANIMPSDLETEYSAIIDSSDGSIIFSNNIKSPFYSFLIGNDSSNINSIKENTSNHADFAEILKVDGHDYTVSGISIGTSATSYYFVKLVRAVDYNKDIASIQRLTIVFLIVIIASFVIILTLVALAYRKQNRLITISRRAAARNDAIIIRAKKNGNIIYCNHRIKKLLDDPSIFKNIKDFVTVDGKTLSDKLKTDEKTIVFFNLKDETIYIEFMIFRYNHTIYLIGDNITKQYEEMKNLEMLTSKNTITKISNYYQFVGEFNRIKDDNKDKNMTFMLINILEYDELVKLFGNDITNQIVVETSTRIKKAIEKNLLYHVENYTFLAVLSDDIKENNTKYMDKIVKVLHNTYNVKTNTLYIKFKYAYLDVSSANVNEIVCDELYRKLLVTLERSKKLLNRDILKYDASIQNYVNYREQMQQDIKKALEEHEFEMYYQPQYDVLEDRIAGFEALIRWNNPKYINISPQEYIEYSEKNGYIIDIGNFIIQDVFKMAKKFEAFGVHISVNVSPAQLFQAGFTSFLLSEFDKNELKPGTIAVEITETFLMENFNVVIEKLNLLRNHGFAIHLDDFGSGYSSLQYLKELPIDTIKTDKDFIKNIVSDTNTKTIIKGIISIAKSLNLKMISEGVETKEQADILKKLGTDYFQGYLISKAIPFDAAMDMLKNGVDIYKKKGR